MPDYINYMPDRQNMIDVHVKYIDVYIYNKAKKVYIFRIFSFIKSFLIREPLYIKYLFM